MGRAPAALTIAEVRAIAHRDLRTIRLLRNRIAHHEPIFTRTISEDYHRIREMISWRSAVAATWMDRKQAVTSLIPCKP